VPILAWLALVTVLPAPEPAQTLTWEAPPECPDAREVLMMAAKLGQRPDDPVAARGVVRRASSGAWVLRLELSSATGVRERRLQAAECPLLARAAALVIAVHRDARALREPDEPVVPEPLPPAVPPPIDRPAPTSPPTILERQPLLPTPRDRPIEAPSIEAPSIEAPSIEAPPIEPPIPTTDRRDPPPTLAGHLRGEGGLDLGLLPGLGGAAALAGGLAIRGVRLELGVIAAPARSRSFASGLGVRLDRVAATLRVCPGGRVGRGNLTLFGCLGAEAGAIRGTGTGLVMNPNPRWVASGALLLGPALRWRIAGPVGLWFAVEGMIALRRPTFTVGTGADSFQVTPVGLRVTLGVDLQFVARKP
jgi:hypothetical protein